MPQALAVDHSDNLPDKRFKIDIAEAFKLRFKNHLSFNKIAEQLNCSAQGVYDALAPFTKLIKNSQDTSIYETNKAGILTSVQFELVKLMTDKSKLKSASLNNIAYSLSQLDNMIRLEKGQPTSITEHLDSDLGGMIDQLCGIKSAGSGSTVANSTHSAPVDILDSLSTVSITPQSEPADILASLEAPSTTIPTQVPGTDRAATGQPEATVHPVQPVKPAKRTKSVKQSTGKSATNSRKQNASNITASLNSKDSVNKEGANPTPETGNPPSQQKEWYE